MISVPNNDATTETVTSSDFEPDLALGFSRSVIRLYDTVVVNAESRVLELGNEMVLDDHHRS
jgi:hypothetical protein